MLTAGSTLAAECITSGFLISLQVAKIRAGKSAVKITWVQGICLLVWMLRIGSVAPGPRAALESSLTSQEEGLVGCLRRRHSSQRVIHPRNHHGRTGHVYLRR